MGAVALKVAAAHGPRGAFVLAALIGAYLLAAWGFALGMPLVNDDWQILARVRLASFADLWGGANLLWGWWRPWSRELHFWTLDRAAGADPRAFHVAGFALWLVVLFAYAALVRRAAGVRVAAIAAAGVALLSAWSGALLWGAGAQELWMLAGVLAFLLAFAARRTPLAFAALAVALLSKETAALAPALALAWALVVERARLGAALRRVAPYAAVVLFWLAVHPTLRIRLLEPARLGLELATRTEPVAVVLARTLGVPLNLPFVPRPVSGWGAAWGAELPALAAAAVLAVWAVWQRDTAASSTDAFDSRSRVRRTDDAPEVPAGRVTHGPREAIHAAPAAGLPGPPNTIVLGATWAAIAWAPLLLPSIDWHPYYALLGALGAWIVLGALLARVPRGFAWAALFGVALLAPAQADTPVWSFSASLYQRRMAYFTGRLRDALMRAHPSLPPHARLYFSRVPNSIGLGYAWFRPAFHVWYSDTTVSGGFWSSYAPRPAAAPHGPDYFFRYDSVRVAWVEVRPEADAAAARAANPRWREDHRELAALFARAGAWSNAASEYAALETAYPDSVEFVMNRGVANEMAGDSAAAARAFRDVLAHPGATAEDRAFAAAFARRGRGGS